MVLTYAKGSSDLSELGRVLGRIPWVRVLIEEGREGDTK